MAKKIKGNLIAVDSSISFNLLKYEEMCVRFSEEIRKASTVNVFAIDPGFSNLAICSLQLSQGAYRHTTGKLQLLDTKTRSLQALYFHKIIRDYAAGADMIVKEGISFGSTHGVGDAGRIQQVIDEVAYELNIPVVTVTPMSMRSYIGSKEKSDTKLKVFQKYGVEFDSEDECDVYAIAQTGLAMVRGEYATKKAPRKKSSKKAA